MKRINTTTKKLYWIGLVVSTMLCSKNGLGQCEVTTSASQIEIQCGESVDLTAFGQSDGDVVLNEDFNSSSFGAGWGSTPGATSFTNPCSPTGVDGTAHAWMDNNTTVPRTLQSAPYDLTSATAGVTICFDLLFATQGGAAPCEGPDEPTEGVYLEYSIDGGTTWQQIHYFDPNGGNDPDLTNWNNWCFQIPPGAITANTIFRWHQTADSGADYDHWGIDNVEIYQNDVNAELVWTHDGYSYGVGNPGGVNPNSVSPTTTTTYTAELTTGNGDVCSNSVTVVVNPPEYDINVAADPTTICDGDCSDITGDANWVIDPGGIETYENNQTEDVSGFGAGSIGASVNVNVQGINTNALTSGMITEVCINDFTYFSLPLFGAPTTVADFEFKLVGPGGCGEIILIPQGSLQPSTQGGPGMQDVCFTVGGATNLPSVPEPYTGVYEPFESFDLANGCDPNGVWTIEMTAPSGISLGVGSFEGWSITFDDPPVYGPTNTTWSPGTGLSSTNTVNTQACPTETTTYTLEIDNGVAGCPTETEDVTITVSPCTGCTPPVLNIDPITVCAPNDADLNSAINASSDPATTTFHNTQADAQNDAGAIGNLVGTSGSYWVRAEDPIDPTCFEVYEIDVTVTTVDYTVVTTDENCGNLDGEIILTGSGGNAPYSYSIDNGATSQASGTFINLSAGVYNVVVIDDNGCEATGNVNIGNIGGPSIDDINFTNPTCNGGCDGEISVTVSGGTAPYSYQWFDVSGNPIGTSSNVINGLCAGEYSIEVSDDAATCPVTSTVTLTTSTTDDASFTMSNYCEGESNSASGIVTPGGTFTFNPVPSDGATIDASTGEISNGVGGSTYTVQYETPGSCPATEEVEVTVNPLPTVDAGVDQTICEGESITLSGTGAQNYVWDNGVTDGVSFTPSSTTTYTVTGTDANGCQNTSSVTITLAQSPYAEFSATPSSGQAPLEVEFNNNSSNGTTYDWDFGNGQSESTSTPTNQDMTYLDPGSYEVWLTVSDGNCTDQMSLIIVVGDLPLIYTIPNIFTPNGDGSNDLLHMSLQNAASIEMEILNRWGNLVGVVNSTDPEDGWNGRKMNTGAEVSDGVYFYTYKIVGSNGEKVEGHHFVHLRR